MGREIRGALESHGPCFLMEGIVRALSAQRQLSSMSRSDSARWPASNSGYYVPWTTSEAGEICAGIQQR